MRINFSSTILHHNLPTNHPFLPPFPQVRGHRFPIPLDKGNEDCNLIPRAFSLTIFKMVDRREKTLVKAGSGGIKSPKMGYSRKNPHPSDGWGRFLTPPSHLDFLKHKIPSCLDFQGKRPPPSRLHFRKTNIWLKFNLFSIENMHNHV